MIETLDRFVVREEVRPSQGLTYTYPAQQGTDGSLQRAMRPPLSFILVELLEYSLDENRLLERDLDV